ncbi:MAG: tetratricopeptide repeat protein, partial [Bacteroidales bacterium]|nr:tetratricopeptide repeat protein [Bacteroidales bacterium]
MVGNNLCSQNISVADSLKDGLNTIDNDSLKVTVLIKIARNEQPKQTLNFAHQALTLSEKLGIDELVAVSYEHIGLGHRKLGNNEKAIEFTLKALNIYEKLGQLYNISTLQLQIGAHFTNDKDFNRGVHYLKLALNSFKSENRSSKLAFTLINLGETYRLMRHLDSAEICFNQCIELNKELNSDLIQGYAVGNLGMVYSEMGCFEKANINLSEAIDLLKPLGDDYSVCIYKSDLAKNFIKEEQLLQGEQLLLESIEMANTGGVKEQIRDFSDDLAELYEEQGRYKKALAYRKQYELYHDSLVNIENVRKIEQIHSQYWIDKKEASIQLLEIENRRKRNHLLMLASGVLLLLSLSMVLFYIQRQRKRALQKVSQQKKIIEKREK